MSATFNQSSTQENVSLDIALETNTRLPESKPIVSKTKTLSLSSQLLLSSQAIIHNPTSGLNPIVDAAAPIFSIIGKVKQIKLFRQLKKLHTQLIQEINTFQETIAGLGYNSEYAIVCRYILCATLDEIISHCPWGNEGLWDKYSLLAAFNQDTHHQDKFFTILERALKEPALYIELMELMYLCLSMGYKGQYRTTEHHQSQLDQITNSLYKHIRAYRGSFSKILSPHSLKAVKTPLKIVTRRRPSLGFISIVTACVIMTIFVSLGYIMDAISNEAYTHIATLENAVSQQTAQQ